MTEKDWQEIRELRLQFMGTSKGIALGNLIAEKQRLDQVRQIVNEKGNIWSASVDERLKEILKEE